MALSCTSSSCNVGPLFVFHDTTFADSTEILPSSTTGVTLNLLNSTGTATVASAAPAAIGLASGSSHAATSLCSTTLCPVGTYRVDAYVEITSTTCSPTVGYIVWLGYTDDSGAKNGSSTTTFIPLQGAGTTTSTGSVSMLSTNNYGQGSFVLHTTGAANSSLGSINYGTTAGVCTLGSASGQIYLTVTRMN
jgi:hypothetical protein